MKRLTETEKWSDSWFSALPIKMKCAWQYLVDRCDHAGLIDINVRIMSFMIGEPIGEDELLNAMGPKLVKTDNGKWFIPGFIKFQYGNELSEKNSAHLGVLRRLESKGVKCPVPVIRLEGPTKALCSPYQAPAKGLPRACQGPKDKDKDKDKDQKGVQGETETIYNVYPRKVGKPAALKSIQKAIDSFGFERLLEATEGFFECWRSATKEELQFCPHPSTWFNQERYADDPATWRREGAGRNGQSTKSDDRFFKDIEQQIERLKNENSVQM
jgi:hypothetical protein